MSPRVAVIGGGLAGITAAIALAEAGAAVTLLEARPRLGGATCSFTRDGLTVDTGQHVFLGCCTAYRGLLDKLGMTAHAPLQDRFDVTVLAPAPSGQVRAGSGGATPPTPRRGRLRRTALPGPLHMLPALARYPFLSFAERSRVSRPALAMRRVDPADPVVDEQRFGDWLAARGQSDRARRALWDLFTVSALNIAGDDASLALAATVVKTGLLGKNNAADIGVPALPLGELHGDAAATLLTKLGAQVLIGAKAAAIDLDGADARFRIRLARPDESAAGHEQPTEIAADAVVLAVSHEAAARLVPPGALPDETVAAWAGLGASPIVNVHVIYDRPVMDLPFAAAVDSPVQWVFDRTRISGLDRLSAPSAPHPEAGETADSPGSSKVNPGFHPAADRTSDAAAGAADAADTAVGTADAADTAEGAGDVASKPQYLAISLSAADEYVDVPAAKLREQFLPALAELFPAVRDAQVIEFFVTRERRATFRQAPGSGRLRPRTGTELPGLVLAGAWTDTGWPDTMEGAVRSGLSAAIELRRSVLSGTGPSSTGHSGSGYSGSVISGSEPNASASTIGVRE
ncbi:MAG TPA: FAD-dependent oxidoreductase [Streptosporangiaceae bacterium]